MVKQCACVYVCLWRRGGGYKCHLRTLQDMVLTCCKHTYASLTTLLLQACVMTSDVLLQAYIWVTILLLQARVIVHCRYIH